jgi:hypothetical protein
MQLLGLNDYDHIIVSFSGGKDSQATVEKLLRDGADPDRLELWHQHIDGKQAGHLMDWPCTPDYCRAYAEARGLRLYSQWKDGGFEAEMLREDSRTTGIYMHDGNGGHKYVAPSIRGKVATRRQFPQVSADLSVRWCSAYLKIDVAARGIANDSRLKDATILYISGERRQESAARSKYKEIEPHRTNGKRRRVDHWRCVIDWTEAEVWEAIRSTGIVPHPAYRLGWSRLSCLSCIFGNHNQWASVQYLANRVFNKIAAYEQDFGKTIHRSLPIIERADRGTIYEACLNASDELKRQAMATDYVDSIRVDRDWKLPAGAYGASCGPT